MFSVKVLKIFLLFFTLFAIGEIFYSVQRYGLPKLNLFGPKPGSCKILEEKYCKSGNIITYSLTEQDKFTYLAFVLPQDANIFSPINGLATKSKNNPPSPFIGRYIRINTPKDPNFTSYVFEGDIQESDPNSTSMQEGKVFGTIGNSEAKMFDKYNLLFRISRINPKTGKAILATDIIKKYFPLAKL